MLSTTVQAAPPSPWHNGLGVVEFPKISDSHFQHPSVIDLDTLNLVDANMSKWQIVKLIGRPHFDEGAFSETAWDYVFRFKQDDGSYKTCQYQIHFERDDRRQFLTNKEMYSTCAPVVKDVTQPKMIALSADALFAFAGGALKDLNPKGRAELDNVGNMIAETYRVVSSIKVVGHTDRLGSETSNAKLSQQRADTVRSYLISRGVSSELISTKGMGMSQPIFSCSDGLRRAQLIECLGPNRRVTIQIDGEQRVR
ncbi:OmpA family protein [Ephemeroptericola cinctiostellae]|nr:OmpA family protein [Ephemeroptericola cinctiostellae]